MKGKVSASLFKYVCSMISYNLSNNNKDGKCDMIFYDSIILHSYMHVQVVAKIRIEKGEQIEDWILDISSVWFLGSALIIKV